MTAAIQGEKTLDGLHIRVQTMVELLTQIPQEKCGSARCIKHQYQRKQCNIQQREPSADAKPSKSAHSSSRTVNPTPRTVWTSFRLNWSSTFRRNRATCTSIDRKSVVEGKRVDVGG